MLIFKTTKNEMVAINADDIQEVNEWRYDVTRIVLKYTSDALFIDSSFKEVMEQINAAVHR